MNAIILARSETLLSSMNAGTPTFKADEIIGWKTEAQRLALGANKSRIVAVGIGNHPEPGNRSVGVELDIHYARARRERDGCLEDRSVAERAGRQAA